VAAPPRAPSAHAYPFPEVLGAGKPAQGYPWPWSVYRWPLAVDDGTWIRGRGRTLSQALIALPYYRRTNPAMAHNARHVIRAVLDDAETSPCATGPSTRGAGGDGR
jgi:hypothetical protein